MGRKIGKKIIVSDTQGRIIAKYDSRNECMAKEGLCSGTMSNFLTGKTKRPRNGKYYSYEGEIINKNVVDNRCHNRKKVVKLDLYGGLLGTYESQTALAKELGVAQGTVSMWLKGKYKPSGFKVMFEKDYLQKKAEEKAKKEPIKREEKMYYVNVLVGLANGTLVDGATYDIDGSNVIYNEKENRLELNGTTFISRERMLEEVTVKLPLLEKEEREFFKTLSKGITIKGIIKCSSNKPGYEFIRISTMEHDSGINDVVLTDFKENKYYKNLLLNKEYTLKELDID